MVGIIPFAVCVIAAFLIGAVIAFFLGVEYRKKSAEATLGSAEEEAKKLISDAIKTSESKKKEVMFFHLRSDLCVGLNNSSWWRRAPLCSVEN